MAEKSREKIKEQVDYPIYEYVFSQLDSGSPVDEVIAGVLQQTGTDNNLTTVVVKELADNNFCIRCSYEWSADGTHKLVDVEHRYFDSTEFVEWQDRLARDGYNTYNIEDGNCPVRVTRNDLIISLIQIPMYRESQLVGCIDFIDSRQHRDWNDAELNTFKQLALIMSSYLLHLRDMSRDSLYARELSEYDLVTGLPKYELFYTRLDEIHRTMKDTSLVIICVDFSNLKYLNERYGYTKGNELLIGFAHEIYEFSDKIISCCRSFSDNFIIACRSEDTINVDTIRSVLAATAKRVVERFRDEYRDCNIIINSGIYIMRKQSENLEQAISNANLARKYAKLSKAPEGYRSLLYNAGMSVRMKRKAEYISKIDEALLNNDFIVQLQPKCMTDTYEVIGAEALVRWDIHKGYYLYPDEFIHTFEEDGCIIKLDYYVYEKVFEYIWHRMKDSMTIVPISLNVSIVHFYDEELVPFLRTLLKRYPIDTKYVEFELTEQIYTSELSNVGGVIADLHELGFKILIDNFGSGYSCLNTFMRFNIDGINLDRNFMKKELEYNDKVIISCIVNMANKLNLEVLCVGVETEEQREFLIQNDCQYMQGNLYSKPLSIAEFSRILDEQ